MMAVSCQFDLRNSEHLEAAHQLLVAHSAWRALGEAELRAAEQAGGDLVPGGDTIDGRDGRLAVYRTPGVLSVPGDRLVSCWKR
jgi:hypothetical protein